MKHNRIDPGVTDTAETTAAAPPDRVADRMTRPVVTVPQDVAAKEAWSLMRSRRIRHLPVVDAAGRLVGIVTDRDLRQLVFDPSLRARLGVAGPDDVPVEAVMTRGVITTRPESSLLEAARLMHERKIGALPVVEGDRVAGILTESDVLGAFVETMGARAIPRSLRWAIAMRRGRE